MVCVAADVAALGPPLKKFFPRLGGPGVVDVGNPPDAPYLTAVNVPAVFVQAGTLTTPPTVSGVADSAPGSLMRLAVVAALAGWLNAGMATVLVTRAMVSSRPNIRSR